LLLRSIIFPHSLSKYLALQNDTIQEKLSLVNRFGVTISYSAPSQKEYFEIVKGLAEKEHITMDEKELCAEANKWELLTSDSFS